MKQPGRILITKYYRNLQISQCRFYERKCDGQCICQLLSYFYFWWPQIIDKGAFVRPIKTIVVQLSATLREICFLVMGLYVIPVIVFSSTYDDVFLAISKLSTSKFHLCCKNTTKCVWYKTISVSGICQVLVNADFINRLR